MIVRGLESAAKGMVALMDMNDRIANNLANVNTVGFKKGELRFKDVMESAVYSQEGSILRNDTSRYLGTVSMGSQALNYVHDFSQGALEKTTSPYDVAIEGDGFFKIQDLEGKVSYTRNGSFCVNSDDYLVTKQGEFVLDVNNRRIRMIPEDWDPELMRDRMEIIIGESGMIEMNSYTQKIPMQTIGVFDFSDKEDLFEIGDTKFVPMSADNRELRAEKFSIQQNMLELSNSNVIKEMINTIQTSRNYESLTKVVSTNNELLRTAVSVGRIGQ
ncbi:MAG: flagellar hook-basal body protein [Cyanobacteria bacterium SIG32]|nr:flagellar hook-basal body protein [Cyanobacteria bacterium SIG32]